MFWFCVFVSYLFVDVLLFAFYETLKLAAEKQSMNSQDGSIRIKRDPRLLCIVKARGSCMSALSSGYPQNVTKKSITDY